MRAVSLLFHDVYVRDPDESGFQSAAANRYKLPLSDFEVQLRGLAAVRADAPILARDLRRPGARSAFPFVLTCDDGGLSYYTVVADRLEALGWRGHCLVSTDLIGRKGFLDVAQIRELHARGHVLGSHSATHPARFSACTLDEMRREWSHSRQVLEDLLGHPVVAASVPGGYFSTAVARTACEAGLRVLFTSEPTTSMAWQGGIGEGGRGKGEGGRGQREAAHECVVIGRFTVRRGDRLDLASRLASESPWARRRAWVTWNAKGLVKPLLGSEYPRIADWLLASGASGRPT